MYVFVSTAGECVLTCESVPAAEACALLEWALLTEQRLAGKRSSRGSLVYSLSIHRRVLHGSPFGHFFVHSHDQVWARDPVVVQKSGSQLVQVRVRKQLRHAVQTL